MVSLLALYSDVPNSNPAGAYSFSVKFVYEKKENKQKVAGVGTFKKKMLDDGWDSNRGTLV